MVFPEHGCFIVCCDENDCEMMIIMMMMSIGEMILVPLLLLVRLLLLLPLLLTPEMYAYPGRGFFIVSCNDDDREDDEHW